MSWQEIAVPKYPKGDSDDAVSLTLMWVMAAGGADQPGRLWAGTLPGGLFRSDDKGDHWSLVTSLWDMEDRKKWFGGGADEPGIHSICVDPRNSSRSAVAVSCGGVWLTEDDGETWTVASKGMWAEYVPAEAKYDPVTQDPHCMAQCVSAPDTYWVQHHNAIFRCTDNLVSWHEVTDVPASNFGFPVAVHPKDPDTAWFVPALDDAARYPVDGKVVVTRTTDGGKSFEVFSEGLPQDNAFDLVYRHALAVDETGEVLAMGSTTGALWFSQNGGEDWDLINAHLPPVYAISFG